MPLTDTAIPDDIFDSLPDNAQPSAPWPGENDPSPSYDANLAWVKRVRPNLTPEQHRKFAAERTRLTIPENPTEGEVAAADVRQRAGDFPRSIYGVIPATLHAGGVLKKQLSRPSFEDFLDPAQYEAALADWKATSAQADPIYKAGDKVENFLNKVYPPSQEPDVWNNVVQGAGQATSALLGGGLLKAAGATTGAATTGAVAMGTTQEFDDAFQRSIARGDDPDTAFAKSLGYASVSAAIENQLGLGRLMRQMFPDPLTAAKKLSLLGVSRKLAGNALAGGVEEGSQRWAQNLIVEGKPSMEGVLDEALPGAIVQGVMGIPGGVAQAVHEGAQFNQEQAFNRASTEAARRQALEATIPPGAATVRPDMQPRGNAITPEMEASIKNALAQAQKQQPAAEMTDDEVGLNEAKVQAELEALPGAEQDLTSQKNPQQNQGGPVNPTTPAVSESQSPAPPIEQALTDLKAQFANLESIIKGNQLAPKPSSESNPQTDISTGLIDTTTSKATTPAETATPAAGVSVAQNTGQIEGLRYDGRQEMIPGQPKEVYTKMGANPFTVYVDPGTPAAKVKELIAAKEAADAPSGQPASSQKLSSQKPAKQRSPFVVRPRPDGKTDILDAIAELGGIAPLDSKIYGNWRDKFTGAARMLLRKNGRSVDQLVDDLSGKHAQDGVQAQQAQTFRVETADDVIEMIGRATAERDSLRVNGGGSDAQADRFWTAISKEPTQKHGLVKINADQLQPGDKFRLRGPGHSHEELEVRTVRDGVVTLKDGAAFGWQEVPEGTEFWVQKKGLEMAQAPAQSQPTDAKPAPIQSTPGKQPAGVGGTGADSPASVGGAGGNGARARLERALRAEFGAAAVPGGRIETPTGDALAVLGRVREGQGAGILAKLFRKRIVYFQETISPKSKRGSIEAFAASGDEIWINAETRRPHIYLIGHELLHALKINNPQLYRELVTALRQLYRDEHGIIADLKSRGYAGNFEEEFIANFVGDSLSNPDFLRRLAEKNPSVFKRVVNRLLAYLDRIIATIKGKGYGSEQWFTDIEQAREILADALNEYAGANRRGAAETTSDQPFSRDQGGFFDAPESVAEQKARLASEKRAEAERKAKADMRDRAAVKITGSDVDTTKEMFGAEVKQDKAGQGSLFSREQTETPEFKRWFGNSKVVSGDGKPLVVYHGTSRGDRVGYRFRKARATSGPMAFFTDDKAIADKYASGKPDTSFERPDDYRDWFMMKRPGARGEVNITQSWHYLSPEQKKSITERLYTTGYQNSDELTGDIVSDSSSIMGRDGIDYELRQVRGNALEAAKEIWLNSGSLFGDEAKFLDVLKALGADGFRLNDPNATHPKTYDVFLRIETPLVTTEIPTDVVNAIEKRSRRQGEAAQYGADAWDKNTRDARDWVRQLREDYNAGKNSMAWTSIPDWVTDTLKKFGYDGIHDTGGKTGGKSHSVWIPFDDHQVKSASENRGTFDPEKADIRFSRENRDTWYFDNIAQALDSWQGKGTPEQLRAHLAKFKGTKDQADWIGLDDFLKDKTSVTKQQVQEFVKANKVEVQEVTKGDLRNTPEARNRLLDERAQLEYGKDYSELTDAQADAVDELMDRDQSYKDAETKFSQYQLPGGENYRELLLTLPEQKSEEYKPLPPVTTLPEGYEFIEDRQASPDRHYGVIPPGQVHARAYEGWHPTMEAAEAAALKRINREQNTQPMAEFYRNKEAAKFKSSHFDEPNILAHVRFNDRTDAQGRKILFLEELQSDWHQKGRKEGYANKPEKVHVEEIGDSLFAVKTESGKTLITYSNKHDANQYALGVTEVGGKHSGVPNAPFKDSGWKKLALRRMLAYAAEHGYDGIGWTTGEQQAERYDLSKQIDNIIYRKDSADTYEVAANKGSATLIQKGGQSISDIEGLLGKEIAKKIENGDGKHRPGVSKTRELSGLDLKVGGEGMKGFYDREMVNIANDIAKKFGQRVERTEIPTHKKSGELTIALDEEDAQDSGYSNFYDDNQKRITLDDARKRWANKETVWGEYKDLSDQVHFLATPEAMRSKIREEGFPLFSREKQEELAGQIEQAQTELLAAIKQHINPPEGMRKSQALEIKNEAASKLQRLIAKQLKVMSSANVDAARSPEQTADMISQTVDLLNAVMDDISARNAKRKEVPADLTQLRQDLHTRLNVLKGWSDDQTELEARGVKAERVKDSPDGRERLIELESATDPEGKTWGDWWNSIKNGLRYLTSPIPELPLTGERAEKSALFRRGYRLFAVENDRVQKEAADKVNHVLEPLVKLGRERAANADLKRYYRLGEALQRAKMDEAKTKVIRAKMLELDERLNKDPFNLFRRLVLYRDLWWRGMYLKTDDGKPITLPMGLTVDEVGAELRKLTKAISKHKDGLAITEALRRHYALTDELQKSILNHGEIIPESLRNPLYFPHHMIDQWSGRIDRVKPTTEEDFRKYLIAPQGSGKLIQTDYLKAMYLHTASVLAHNSRVDLVQKYWQPYDISAQLKTQHGGGWNKPWNIPAGYKVFTPFKKLPLRMDYILSREVLADKLGVLFNDGDMRARMGEAGRVLKVKPEDLHAAMVAGEKIQWVLPSEIADALNGIAKRENPAVNNAFGHIIGLPVRVAVGFWKLGRLFLPWNWVRYEYGNLATDAIDKVLAADPVAARYLSRAAREVWNADKADQTPEYKAAQREGVFDTITAGEAGDLIKLPAFDAFLTSGEKRVENIRKVLASSTRGSAFREATFRYANFLANVERLRAGKEPVYSGAFHGDIEALGEDVDGQRKLLEGDELIYAKAAEISLKTFGDYNSIGVAGQWLRRYAAPFWSWQDVNFRYHANQLRNIADAMRGVPGATSRQAALRYAGVRVVTTLLAVGIAKELWNQFGGVAMGLWDDDDDLESKLSAQDRRKGHLIVGKDKNGQAMVVYTPSAFSDVAEWMGGQNMKRLFMEYARGQITLDQFVSDYAKQLPDDVVNKIAQSTGPAIKTPYEMVSGKSTFPDILDQRTIPKADRWWRLVGNLTDDRSVNVLRGAFDKDYYSQPAAEQLQQIILQVRRRDSEQWAYYEAKEQAADWKEAKTGKRFEAGDYQAPEAQALRNFRKAIYRGDVATAERFYGRLLEYGYTAERLDASIRNQSPLSGLNEAQKKEYLTTLDARSKQQLALAEAYYKRFSTLDGRERRLFPRNGQIPRPNPELLKQVVEQR